MKQLRAAMLCGLLVTVFGVLGASSAYAGANASQKCEAGKNKETGKYAACRHKAEAKLLSTKGICAMNPAKSCYSATDCNPGDSCTKDPTKFNETLDKCEAKLAATWDKLTLKASSEGTPCPDGLVVDDIKTVVDECVANAASGLAGTGLGGCAIDLAACNSDLNTCDTSLATCSADLTTAETALAGCSSDLQDCNQLLASAQACGDGDVDAGEDCDLGDLAGATCVSQGFSGGTLLCGAGCVYDQSSCYLSRFTENFDGTISDNDTGLMWEKKVKLDSTTDLSNLRDADNAYRWAGTCTVGGAQCQPDADSETACFANVEGASNGCAQCTSGTCTVGSPGVTVWQWLANLNAASASGYNDWRLATKGELVSILDDTDTSAPVVNSAFQGGSCGAACTNISSPACSCTRSGYYWASSTYAPTPNFAWGVQFSDGFVDSFSKTSSNHSVRAVRGGE